MDSRLGKWRKYKVLASSRRMISSLPQTLPWSKSNLWALLYKYKSVIDKPISGSGGFGVLQVSILGKGRFNVHYGRSNRTLIRLKSVYSYVNNIARRSGGHIVQQKIPLAKVRGNKEFL